MKWGDMIEKWQGGDLKIKKCGFPGLRHFASARGHRVG